MTDQALNGSGGNHLARVIERLHRPVMLQEAGKHRTLSRLTVGKLQLFAHATVLPWPSAIPGLFPGVAGPRPCHTCSVDGLSRALPCPRVTAGRTASPQTRASGRRA